MLMLFQQLEIRISKFNFFFVNIDYMADPPESLKTLFPNADLTNSVLTHFNVQTLITKITKYIKLIPQFQKLKLDPELTKIILNIIKSEVEKY